MKKFVSVLTALVMSVGFTATAWGATERVRVIEPKYDLVDSFSEGLANVSYVNRSIPKWSSGFIDRTGKEVIPIKDDYQYENFSEGLARAWYNPVGGEGKQGFIDKTGAEVIPLKAGYTYGDFSEGLASFVTDDGRAGFIDKTGNEVAQFENTYETLEISPLSDGVSVIIAKVGNQNKYGYVDRTGKLIVPPTYEGVSEFDGLGIVQMTELGTNNTKYGCVDRTGNVIVPIIYSSTTKYLSGKGFSESEGLVGFCLDGKWGYINNTGKEVIPFIYDSAQPFCEGLASVSIDRQYGYIDTAGNVVVPLIYKNVSYSFTNGFAEVSKDGEQYTLGENSYTRLTDYFVIDRNGNEVFQMGYIDTNDKPIPRAYMQITGYFINGRAIASYYTQSKFIYSLVDESLNTVMPLNYETVSDFSKEGLAWVKLNGKWGVIDTNGVEVVSPQFDLGNGSFDGDDEIVRIGEPDSGKYGYVLFSDF